MGLTIKKDDQIDDLFTKFASLPDEKQKADNRKKPEPEKNKKETKPKK